jgi:hypothetical protein
MLDLKKKIRRRIFFLHKSQINLTLHIVRDENRAIKFYSFFLNEKNELIYYVNLELNFSRISQN